MIKFLPLEFLGVLHLIESKIKNVFYRRLLTSLRRRCFLPQVTTGTFPSSCDAVQCLPVCLRRKDAIFDCFLRFLITGRRIAETEIYLLATKVKNFTQDFSYKFFRASPQKLNCLMMPLQRKLIAEFSALMWNVFFFFSFETCAFSILGSSVVTLVSASLS